MIRKARECRWVRHAPNVASQFLTLDDAARGPIVRRP
jgi:hypothetical protein